MCVCVRVGVRARMFVCVCVRPVHTVACGVYLFLMVHIFWGQYCITFGMLSYKQCNFLLFFNLIITQVSIMCV